LKEREKLKSRYVMIVTKAYILLLKDGSVNTIYFNSKRNVETVKHIIEVDGSKPNEATVCDMQEIKHGSWEYDSEGVGYANYLCSECGNFLTFYEDIDLYPYCPYCGAKMKQERDTD